MQDTDKNTKRNKVLHSIAFMLILLGAAVSMQYMARNTTWFGTVYARTIYPVLTGTIGRLSGLAPFSIVELGLYIGTIGFAVDLFLHVKSLWKPVWHLAMFTCTLLFLYTINCGVNYYRRPFSSYLELETGNATTQDLVNLCEHLTEQVNGTLKDIRSQEDGEKQLDYEETWNQIGVKSMKHLGEQYPQLKGYYPRPKPVAVSWILSVQQLSGVYAPFTIEANYNREMTDYNIPHTICHELSHLRGFMREDEANFIGYLACIQSDEPAFAYSGYLTGWVYAGNALAKVDTEAYRKLYEQLDDRAKEDLKQHNAFWNKYEGKIAEASTQVNDTYLKINDQSDGVQTYGQVVDLMLAYEK